MCAVRTARKQARYHLLPSAVPAEDPLLWRVCHGPRAKGEAGARSIATVCAAARTVSLLRDPLRSPEASRERRSDRSRTAGTRVVRRVGGFPPDDAPPPTRRPLRVVRHGSGAPDGGAAVRPRRGASPVENGLRARRTYVAMPGRDAISVPATTVAASRGTDRSVLRSGYSVDTGGNRPRISTSERRRRRS